MIKFLRTYLRKVYTPAMLGAAVEYYDVSLYGYMAPILVPLFLPHWPRAEAYFFYFLFDLVAAMAQVWGAKVYGTIGDRWGRTKALYWAMLGTSMATCGLALIPTYKYFGIFAVILFCGARAAQSFFLGGEYMGGATYCLEHEPNPKIHGFLSGLYAAHITIGIIGASFVVAGISLLDPFYFRLAYIPSLGLGWCVYRFRRNLRETPEFLHTRSVLVQSGNPSWGPRLALVGVSVFLGILYAIPTRVLNAVLPMVTDISTTAIMLINTLSMVGYMGLVLVFGAMTHRYGVRTLLHWGALAVCIATYPLFWMLSEAPGLITLLLGKIGFVALNALCSAPFHAWTQTLFPVKTRYTRLSVGYAMGKVLSHLIIACAFPLFQAFEDITLFSVLICIPALVALGIFRYF